jgi:magnesium transporter
VLAPRRSDHGGVGIDTSISCVAQTRLYQDGRLTRTGFPVDDVSDYVSQPDTVVWVDLCGPTVADIEMVGEELGLHELAVEDAIESHQRPKLDRYASHAFLSLYAVDMNPDTGQLRLSELAVFITPKALVTVRDDDTFDIATLTERWDASSDLTRYGVGFLLYGLIDLVVDGHFDAVQVLDDQIEQLEDVLFDDNSRNIDVQRRSFALRKSLVTLRRVVLPMREVVNTLMRRDFDIASDQMRPYFEDVYDHVLRATEWTESLRDLVTTILETNLTIQGNRLNVITKQVTSWAAIIAVPTAVTGYYGQNIPFPGFAQHSGFVASSLLIVLLSLALYVAFRRRDWL